MIAVDAPLVGDAALPITLTVVDCQIGSMLSAQVIFQIACAGSGDAFMDYVKNLSRREIVQ